MSSKTQINIEFFVFLGMAFLIAIAFEISSLDQLRDFRVEKESESVKDLALKLQREILIAAAVEDGYSRLFSIPSELDNVNYSLTMQNSTIMVQSKSGFYLVSVPRSTGNFSKGSNKISKTGGVIYINID